MSDQIQTAADDLAYLRGIVDSGGGQKTSGLLFVAAGLLYGGQLLGHWAQNFGMLKLSPLGGLALIVGPTLIFLVFMTWVLVRNRNRNQPTGTTAKAFSAVFSSIGLTNLVMVAIFAPAAIREQSWNTWLFYGAVVYALQGGGWLTSFSLRRELWMAVTAAGWFAAAIVMGLSIGVSLSTYTLVAAGGIVVLMVGPGLVMLRKPA
jgi:hypothetical protein